MRLKKYCLILKISCTKVNAKEVLHLFLVYFGTYIFYYIIYGFAWALMVASCALNQRKVSWVNLFLAQSFLVFQ